MKDLGITKGDWHVSFRDRYTIGISCNKRPLISVKIEEDEKKEAEANAKLIADAGTTANKCGLLPSELLNQREEMLDLLIRLSHFEPLAGSKEIEELIKKITKQ